MGAAACVVCGGSTVLLTGPGQALARSPDTKNGPNPVGAVVVRAAGGPVRRRYALSPIWDCR